MGALCEELPNKPTAVIWPSPVPYNGRYSVRPERKEEQEAADLHLFWVRPESEKVDQKLRGCLLYTSPSPRDYAASRMPSSA